MLFRRSFQRVTTFSGARVQQLHRGTCETAGAGRALIGKCRRRVRFVACAHLYRSDALIVCEARVLNIIVRLSAILCVA